MNVVSKYAAMSAWYNGAPKKKFLNVQPSQKEQRENIVEYIKRIEINKVN